MPAFLNGPTVSGKNYYKASMVLEPLRTDADKLYCFKKVCGGKFNESPTGDSCLIEDWNGPNQTGKKVTSDPSAQEQISGSCHNGYGALYLSGVYPVIFVPSSETPPISPCWAKTAA